MNRQSQLGNALFLIQRPLVIVDGALGIRVFVQNDWQCSEIFCAAPVILMQTLKIDTETSADLLVDGVGLRIKF